MKIGFIGLGKMGFNMTKRLLHSHEVVVYDVNDKLVSDAKATGAIEASSIEDLISKLDSDPIVWMMVPSGEITNKTISECIKHLKKNSILIDGGNSFYKDSLKRSKDLREKGIDFLDIGTSGGVWGLKEGYCLMVGGEKKAFDKIEPILKTLTSNDGYEYMGKSGSGHYVKMIHNAIEYGMMQAYAEGFDLLKSKKEFDLDLYKITNVWKKGSVVRSWLLDLISNVFKEDQSLDNIKAYVEDSGEGRWSINEAIEQNVSIPAITISLFERFSSRDEDNFKAKLLSSMRNQFGGHQMKKKGE
ncbi:MAG: 6-phosphogluconate dehydrogenase, NAD(+)-dependent, decarboxylating [Candidatus Anoxychlamydiales bacterium]|nr:6-phosphogluconate dehydrogenase, NAD(+)-dependent, decarboxylating [Candidatus Anoxychlamydiales bacterium]